MAKQKVETGLPARALARAPARDAGCRRLNRVGVAVLSLFAGGLVLVSGCPDPNRGLAETRAARRIERLGQAPRVWGRDEQARPGRVVAMVQHGGWYIGHQADELGRNGRAAGRLIERDLRRPIENAPAYGKEGLKLLYGKPERIEGNAIILFF